MSSPNKPSSPQPIESSSITDTVATSPDTSKATAPPRLRRRFKDPHPMPPLENWETVLNFARTLKEQNGLTWQEVIKVGGGNFSPSFYQYLGPDSKKKPSTNPAAFSYLLHHTLSNLYKQQLEPSHFQKLNTQSPQNSSLRELVLKCEPTLEKFASEHGNLASFQINPENPSKIVLEIEAPDVVAELQHQMEQLTVSTNYNVEVTGLDLKKIPYLGRMLAVGAVSPRVLIQ